MAGPSITWQTATTAIETAGGELPAWHDVLHAESLEQFSAWMEAHLAELESHYAGDATPRSVARDLLRDRLSRGTHP